MKMKRKDGGVDEVSDDFSEISLSSPARKIRRLNRTPPRVLPPIREDDDDDLQSHRQPPDCDYSYNLEDHHPAATSSGSCSVIIEEMPCDFDSDLQHQHLPSSNADHTLSNNNPDQGRAIVLFKPVSKSPLYSPSSFSLVSVDSDILSGIKNNRFPWSSKFEASQKHDGQTQEDEKNGKCLAVVPWIPSSLVSAPVASSEFMEADEMDVDFEDNNTHAMDTATSKEQQVGMATVNAAPSSPGMIPPWQQHCMIPQIPTNASTPII